MVNSYLIYNIFIFIQSTSIQTLQDVEQMIRTLENTVNVGLLAMHYLCIYNNLLLISKTSFRGVKGLKSNVKKEFSIQLHLFSGQKEISGSIKSSGHNKTRA